MGFSIPTPGGGDEGGSGSGFPLTGDTDVGGFDLENVGEGDAPGEAVTLGQLDERGAILNAADGSPATAYISADDTDDPADLPDFPGDGAWWLNLADLGSPDAANVTFDDSGLIVITGVGDVKAALAAVDAALVARPVTPRLISRAMATRTAGSLTLNNTNASFTQVPSIGDLTLACAAGDVVEFSVSGLCNNEAVTVSFDVGTIVSAAVVNKFASTAEGIQGWHARDSVFTQLSGGYEYIAQAGDIDSGNIVLRLLYKTGTAANKTLFAASDRPLRISARVTRWT